MGSLYQCRNSKQTCQLSAAAWKAVRSNAGAFRLADVVILTAFGAMLIFMVVMLSAGFWHGPEEPQAICFSHEKQIALALRMYAEDWDGRLPLAYRWTDAIWPYIMDARLLRCPADRSRARCSYAMNAALSGMKLADIADQWNTILVFETSWPGHSPSGGRESVARPGRHDKGNNFAFVDGRVKWYEYEQTPAFGPTPQKGSSYK